jgi:hypothetical protein
MSTQKIGLGMFTVMFAVCAASLAISATASGQLIAHEPFAGEYDPGDDLAGRAGGAGFAGVWTAAAGVSIQAAPGLSLGKFPTSGKAMALTRSGRINAERFAFRQVKGFGTKQELWFSYLARWTKDNGGKGHDAYVGLGTYPHDDDSSFKIHTKLLTVNDENRFAVGYGNRVSKVTSQSNQVGKTMLVVGRWAGLVGDDQQATLWVFDSAEAANAALAADSLDVLDKQAYTKQSVAGLVGALGNELGIKLGGFIGGDPGAYTIVVDELRLGHTAGDVLPGAAIESAAAAAPARQVKPMTPLPVGGRTIYVATDGDDASADPTSIDTPLRTIGKAASIALAGDTVAIRGGEYRESVRIERVATAENPIVFKPHQAEKVTVSGVDVVEGRWEKIAGDKPIYAITLADRFESKQTQSNQVFVDGDMIDVARHPNFSEHGDRMQPGNWFTVDHFVGSHGISGETEWGPILKGPSERATIIAEEIEASDGTWDDAQVWIKPEEHGVSWGFGWACPVIEHKGKRLTFDMAGEVSEFNKIAPGIRFFLYDARNLLDAPGEWWLDREANRLYVWLPGDADPNDHKIEVKRRDWAFDLSDSAYVTLKDIHVFGATITTDNEYSDGRGGGGWITNNRDSQNPDVAMGNARAHHITLDGIRATYVSHFMGTWGFMHGQWTKASGIQLVGEDHVMRNCLVAHSAGNGVSVFGYRHKLVNNVIHDVAYSGAHASGIFFTHGTQTPILPTDYEVAHNTLYRAGWGLIDCSNLYSSDPANPSRIHHNFIDAPGLISKDVGGIRFVGHTKPPHEVNGTRVDHNFVRGCVAALGNAIYFDFNNNYQADHNLVAHSINLMNINDAHDMLIAHNTGHTLQGGIGGNPKRTKYRNVRVVNNLTNRGVPDRMDRLDPTYQQSHNIVAEDLSPLVADLQANNFHLAEGSKAIDGGVPIEGLAHPTVGAAPDVGALEHGTDDWTKTIGADWVHEPAPTELKVQPRPDGSVELSWKDNADGEEGFIVERGYKTDHPNGGWEYIIVARTAPNETYATDQIDGAYTTYFYRVRTTRSYYSTEVVLRAGLAAAGRIGFEQSGGYETGDLIDQTSWLGVHSGQGVGKAHPDGFNVVDLNGNRVLKITGDGRAAALGSMNAIAPEFQPGASKVRFAVKLGIVNPVANTDDNAIDIKIGGLDHWHSPGNVLCSVVVGRDGTLKWGWKPLAKLTDHTSDDKSLIEVVGVIDSATGKVISMTVGGQSVQTKGLNATKGVKMGHALWQINAGTGGDTAVLVDDLTLEVVE